jgi:hypothetical protein
MRICPRGEENSTFFNCHFLQKLPRELRVLLSEADMSEKRQLSGRADQIWAHHVQHHHDLVATVAVEQETEDPAVAAVHSARGRGRGAGRGGSHGCGGGCANQPPSSSGQAAAGGPTVGPSPAKLAEQASGLCRNHFLHDEKAYYCSKPSTCAWQGN